MKTMEADCIETRLEMKLVKKDFRYLLDHLKSKLSIKGENICNSKKNSDGSETRSTN